VRGAVRQRWLRVHRWLALGLGVVLALQALVGTALIVTRPLDRWAHPELFVVATSSGLAPGRLEQVRRSLVHEWGAATRLTLRPPREPGESLWAMVHGAWDGTVYFDPATGAELGRRGEHEGVFNLLFEWHSSLLLGDAGKALLAGLALSYFVLLASGLVLWWPRRWRRALHVERAQGVQRLVFDLHRVGGALLGVLIGVVIASGAYMAWRPLSALLTAAAGDTPVALPKVVIETGAASMPLDGIVGRARALFPAGSVGYVQAGATREPVRVRLRLPDDPHPNGLTSVWLHPQSGAVLAAVRWDRLDLGSRAYAVVYPLHIGQWLGPAQQVMHALLGSALVALIGAGLWLWWQRRPRRSRRMCG
jgi:uncharacterized iron-regulated membrane protein